MKFSKKFTSEDWSYSEATKDHSILIPQGEHNLETYKNIIVSKFEEDGKTSFPVIVTKKHENGDCSLCSNSNFNGEVELN